MLVPWQSKSSPHMSYEEGRATPPKRSRWRSLMLLPWVLGLLLLTEVGLLASILVLYMLSRSKSGFLSLGPKLDTSSDLSIWSTVNRRSPLLWTSLPTLVFVLFRIFRGSVITAFTVETPYLELFRAHVDKPTEVKKSVYLDYRTMFAVAACPRAFQNGHHLLGVCMVLSFISSIIIVPLTARLFAESEELLLRSTPLNLHSVYRGPLNMSSIDYGLILNDVSASWIADASFPPGTDGIFALPRVSPVTSQQDYTIKLDSSSPRVTLDCEVILGPELNTTLETSNILRTRFSALDRGCSISGSMISGPGYPAYLGAFSKSDCAASDGLTRIFILYASYLTTPAAQLTKTSLVSCIPSYWNSTGWLDITSSQGSTGKRVETPAFSPDKTSLLDLSTVSRRIFEEGLLRVTYVNPSSEVNTPTRFAEMLVNQIRTQESGIDDTSIKNAAEKLFPAAYTVLNLQHFYETLSPPLQTQGFFGVPDNRLHTVGYAAIAVCVLLAILAVETICLMWYLSAHERVLAEEPRGLVGAANLLYNSDIPNIIATFHDDHNFDGRLRRKLKEPNGSLMKGEAKPRWWSSKKSISSDTDLLESTCWVERNPDCPCVQIRVKSKNGVAPLHAPSCGHSAKTSAQRVNTDSWGVHQRGSAAANPQQSAFSDYPEVSRGYQPTHDNEVVEISNYRVHRRPVPRHIPSNDARAPLMATTAYQH